jgi:hypothetical protein
MRYGPNRRGAFLTSALSRRYDRTRPENFGNPSVADADPSGSCFLVVADYEQGFFCIEGPMTDDRPWNNAVRHARDNFHRRVVCGPSGPDRNTLAADLAHRETWWRPAGKYLEATPMIRGRPICGRPPPRKVFCGGFDPIACVHMSGLSMRPHMNAGQDGFRDNGSKQHCDLVRGHWVCRSVPRRGSIDHTICLNSAT